MKDFIIQLVSMSIQASIAIVAVLILRILFAKCKISKKYVMLLWVIPFICLILPWRIASPIAIWDKAPSDYGYENLVGQDTPLEDEDGLGNNAGDIVGTPGNPGNNIGNDTGNNSGNNAGDTVEKPGYNSGADNGANNGANNGTDIGGEDKNPIGRDKIAVTQILQAATVIWGIVVLVLALYSGINYGKLKKQLSQRVRMHDNIYMVDDLEAPIVVGFRKPEIYIPSGYNTEHIEYVIAHEQTHIRRKDIISKMAAYCVTCIHWFNPLVWLAYNLMIKDMEMACDEETVSILGQERKHEYAKALLQLSTGRRHVLSVPLAFGEGGTKMRIVNILKYQKTKQILAIVALAIGIVLAIVFLTKGIEQSGDSSNGTEDSEGVGSTETETEETENTENSESTENTENTENSESTENTENTEVVDTNVSENTESETEDIVIESLEPDMIFEHVNLYYNYYKIINNELISYPVEYTPVAVKVFDGEEYFDLKFRWGYYEAGKMAVHPEALFEQYYPATSKTLWSHQAVNGNEDLVWIWQHPRNGGVTKKLLIYSLSQEKILAEYDISEVGVGAHKEDSNFCTANFFGLDHIAITTSKGLFVYQNNEWNSYPCDFSALGGYLGSMILKDKVIYYSMSPDLLYSFVYDASNNSFVKGLDLMQIEYAGYNIFPFSGGYVQGVLDRKFVVINLSNGNIVYPEIRNSEYRDFLDIDEKMMLCLKRDGTWIMIDKETGETHKQSNKLIPDKGKWQAFIQITEEGKVYLGFNRTRGAVSEDVDIALYDIGYTIEK